MGKLAMYGALSGLGEGMVQKAQMEFKGEQSDLDRKHSSALAKLKIDSDRELAGSREVSAERRHTETLTAQKAMTVTRQEGAGERTEAAIAGRASEGALGRESSEKIAGIRTAGIEGGKPKIFTSKRNVPGKSEGPFGMPVSSTEEITLRYDYETGKLEESQGGKWVPADLSNAEQKLAKNPDQWEQWTTYKALPDWYIAVYGDPTEAPATQP